MDDQSCSFPTEVSQVPVLGYWGFPSTPSASADPSSQCTAPITAHTSISVNLLSATQPWFFSSSVICNWWLLSLQLNFWLLVPRWACKHSTELHSIAPVLKFIVLCSSSISLTHNKPNYMLFANFISVLPPFPLHIKLVIKEKLMFL